MGTASGYIDNQKRLALLERKRCARKEDENILDLTEKFLET